MEISFGTCLHSFFLGSIIIFILYFFRKKYVFTRKIEVAGMFIIYFLCITRMIFPIDFSFSVGIPVRGLFSDFYSLMTEKRIICNTISFSIWDIFLIITALGAIRNLFSFFRRYLIYMRNLKNLPLYHPSQIERVCLSVSRKMSKKINCSIIYSPEQSIPMAIGLFKNHKTIILPDTTYSDEELYYILLHEYTHFANGDLYLKFLICILCCIMWWNPLFILLRNDLSQMLEIKCDLSVSKKLSTPELEQYMSVLLNNIRKISTSDKKQYTSLINAASAGLAKRDCGYSMKERFRILCAENKSISSNRIITILLGIIATLLLFGGSYILRPLPSYEAPIAEIEEDGAIYIDPELTYLINRDGTYYMMLNGQTEILLSENEVNFYLKEDAFPVKKENN